MRRQGGWTEDEIAEEFAVYDTLLSKPYTLLQTNPRISYDIDYIGKPQNLRLGIRQLSIYWRHKTGGKSYKHALKLTLSPQNPI